MSGIVLSDAQIDSVHEMHNGCILCGGVGSGKTRTSLAYYYTLYGGELGTKYYVRMKDPPDLYVITTAKKRDSGDWEEEMAAFMITKGSVSLYSHKVTVDSWNNIARYKDVTNAFFIFDEQRVVGKGKWAKSFIRIARRNKWVLLSATPGDTWLDYIPVFIANGFYRNRQEFNDEHVNWCKCGSFWREDTRHFRNEGRLISLRRQILVDIDVHRRTIPHHEYIFCEYDKDAYRRIMRFRQDEHGIPFQNAAGMCIELRRLCSMDGDRQKKLLEILDMHPKAIIFYCFNFERDLLRNLGYAPGTVIAEWNGEKHMDIPTGDKWVYLVQYTAGAEGWNCITTDTIIFYSQQYSWKIQAQACGRTDRMNTPFTDLWYYHMVTKSPIELAIRQALNSKKTFTERGFLKW